MRERDQLSKLLRSGNFHRKAICRAANMHHSTLVKIQNGEDCNVRSVERLLKWFRELKKEIP